MFLKPLFIGGCIFLPLLGCARAGDAIQPGFVEGHLRIFSLKAVELAEASPSKGTAENYAEYPLIILSESGKREIAPVTADNGGNYRVALPPGDYILDVERRVAGHIRAKPQPFTVVANHTVRVDMEIDADHSRN